MVAEGLLDTSVLIARETGRGVRREALPERVFVSVVSLAELQAGVLAAADVETRQRRLATVSWAAARSPLSVEPPAAAHWARLRAVLHREGRRAGVNDLWIASVALAHSMPVVTQDADFDVLEELGLVDVVRV